MKSSAIARVDPSVIVSLVAAGMLALAAGTSQTFGRSVRLIAETAWLYLSNTRG